ncbi:uncharacterized protein EV154DRAFT_193443 [Mucor mucedo]|uniref:uncharacterized protein n=1 Tax=Mucor mucedo TaxID=29922 RepID=UPI002220C3F7|nr:uncharacterized protein EV154DRAFT_193443 [Mucor mucedo]KAI7892418.1 hypothetical protein EV154DRAFT_193443 [Mucor mucedo]
MNGVVLKFRGFVCVAFVVIVVVVAVDSDIIFEEEYTYNKDKLTEEQWTLRRASKVTLQSSMPSLYILVILPSKCVPMGHW